MRRLVISALSASILLCIPGSIAQCFGLNSIGRTHLGINSLRGGPRAAQSSASERGAAPGAQESFSLEPGKPVERELSEGRSHSYNITTISGQYLHIVVEQRGIDVAVALFTPDGKKISEVDGERMTVKTETISAIAEVSGAYRIEVRSTEKTAKTGRYGLKVETLREATAEDKLRVAAESLFREAEQLKEGTLEARKKSIEKYQEASELYKRAGDRLGEANAINDIGYVYRQLGDVPKALEHYNQALSIRQAAGDGEGQAETLINIGVAYLALADNRKALDKFNDALPILRTVGDRKLEAIVLYNTGMAYWALGKMQSAQDKLNEALLILRAIGDRRGEAVTLGNIGAISKSVGDVPKALDKFNDVLPVLRAIGDRQGEAVTLGNIGNAYMSLGDIRKALDKFNESTLISRAVGDRKLEASTLNNMGMAYWSLGDIQKALDKLNEVLPIRRAIGDRDGEATTLNNIGAVYRSFGETQKALEMYNEALPIRRAIGDRDGEATTLNNIGAVYRSFGEMQKALETYNEALPIRRQTADRRGEAITLKNIGIVYRSLGDIQKALEKYNEALSISRAIGARSEEGSALHDIGDAYAQLGEVQKALEKYNEALSIKLATGERLDEADTLVSIAQAERKLGNLTRAQQRIEQAIDTVESVRAEIRPQDLRASYFALHRMYYETYIDILMDRHRQGPAAGFSAAAFAVSERSRARSLLELLKELRADIRQGVDGSLLERERSLQQLLNAKAAAQSNLLKRNHTPAQAEAAAKEIASITNEFEELRAKIRESSPQYADLTQPQPLSLAEIQKQVLDPDTLLLEYSLGDDASYLFVVSQTSITSHRLPKRAEIEAAARRVRSLLITPQFGATEAKYQAHIKAAGEAGAAGEAEAGYWPRAAELSRMLLGPVASQLGRKRLAIVADGALQYIPFAALPAPSPGNDKRRNSGAGWRPLFVEHEIVSLPSASTLATLRRETAGRKPAEKSLAVLADPVFTDDDARVRRNASKTRAVEESRSADSDEKNIGFLQMSRSGLETGVTRAEAAFGRLLGTRHEAAAISALVPERERKRALDFVASRTTALSPELGQYRILHFATHGMLNSLHPELSGIVLSLVDEAGKPQDGFLRLQDIYNLKLPVELVVLSACQTGLGKEIKGEGLIGLTRGFMYAGAPRVVASLWKVDDRATSELMKRFYRGMLGPDALRPADALRKAQLSMWKEKQWREPYYWAAFVLQGEWK
jgi:CHAT domain-containing protein/Tfp pilus assembly protein PilF